jgi:heat shock protein HslJ
MNALRCVALISLLAAAPAMAQQGRQQPPAPAQSGSGALAPRQDKIFDLGVTWMAVSLNGKPFSGADRPSFSIDKQFRARGFGGCNTFAATAFPLREQRLAVSPLTWTKKTCAPAVMASEMAFFQAIRYAVQWDQQGSTLIIKSQNGDLRFERAI